MSISENEAKELFQKLVDLKSNFEKSNSKIDSNKLNRHKNLIIQKLKYLVDTKLSIYRKFHNYEDLKQEGYEALVMGLNNFDPSKGSIFWWLHKYIDTRIARKANAHSIVKIPIKVAKNTPPRVEQISMFAEDTSDNPEDILHKKNLYKDLENRINKLNIDESNLLKEFYGLNQSKINVNDYCKNNNITKNQLQNKINNIINKIK